MMNIKTYLYSFIVLIIILSLIVSFYSYNKMKNMVIKQQNANITAQEKSINLHQNSQNDLNSNLDNLTKKQLDEKKIFNNKISNIYNTDSNNKGELYKQEFNNILTDIEVISGQNNSN